MSNRQSILLHACCAPCASASLERLLDRDYQVSLYFSNANIFPRDEYDQRLDSMHDLARLFDVPLHIDAWDHDAWLAFIAGLEQEPEKGRRCLRCFEFNFTRTRLMADQLDIPSFTTTLSISPHKPSSVIFEMGSHFPGFIPIDFKKKNGFQRSLELSRQHGLYRQRYCGCEFSAKS